MIEPRTVVRFSGAIIQDAHEHIRIVFSEQPKHGLPGKLWNAGFSRRRDQRRIFEARMTQVAIENAQALLRESYGEELA